MSTSEGLAAHLGMQIADARAARRWTLAMLAERSGVSITRCHDVEHGRPASLESYAAIAAALGRTLRVNLIDPRRREGVRLEDPVHAAMGECEARRLAAHGVTIAIDEPYQHYQFAGRADLLSWTPDATDLLHIENRTRFPNIQEAAGTYNAKRRYLPGVIAERLGNRGFRSVTHVMAILWSSEAMHSVRIHRATFAALCPDGPDALGDWWHGTSPLPRVTSTLIVVDPASATARHRTWAPLEDATRARYRGYAEAVEALSRAARARS